MNRKYTKLEEAAAAVLLGEDYMKALIRTVSNVFAKHLDADIGSFKFKGDHDTGIDVEFERDGILNKLGYKVRWSDPNSDGVKDLESFMMYINGNKFTNLDKEFMSWIKKGAPVDEAWMNMTTTKKYHKYLK